MQRAYSFIISVLLLSACHTAPDPILATVAAGLHFCEQSPFNQPIAADTPYIPQTRIAAFRPHMEEYAARIYRLTANSPAPTAVTVQSPDDTEQVIWQLPSQAQLLASAPLPILSDHLLVLSSDARYVYDVLNPQWLSESVLLADGFQVFALNGSGIGSSDQGQVTLAGFSTLAGMVTLEDFVDPQTGYYDPRRPLKHALTMSLNGDLLTATHLWGVPVGTRFALGADMPDNVLDGLHPLTRTLALAARDYGIYVNDANNAPPIDQGYVGHIRVEVGLSSLLYGFSTNRYLDQIEAEMVQLVSEYGLYRLDDGLHDAVSCQE